MRSLLVLRALARVAAADPDVDWDGSYVGVGAGGDYLCPQNAKAATITVANNAFSLPWLVRTASDALIRVGTIDGTVRGSGYTTMTAKLDGPIPAKVLEFDGAADTLHKIESSIHGSFRSTATHRLLSFNGGNDCYSGWESGPAPASPKSANQPAPSSTGKPSALPAGSAKWDVRYLATSDYADDWRCPKRPAAEWLVVSKGRFSLPYVVVAHDRRGRKYGDMTLGQIDGTIAANGEVKLRTWLSISELPVELAEGHPANEATLDYVRALPLKMTFSTSGKARLGDLKAGSSCNLHFESATTFKPGRSVDSAPDKRADGASCRRDNECKSDTCDGGSCRAK